MEYGIYIHIPFCSQKCYYCDFPSYAGMMRYQDAYVKALCREIRHSAFLHQAADTIYVGGGTPNTLPAEKITDILHTVAASFAIKDKAEITVEANPAFGERTWYEQVKSAGVNRMSFGVQSFWDEELRNIGRLHTGEEAIHSVEEAFSCGIENISIDLIYGLPGQTLEKLSHTIETAMQLPITHISVYGLKVEDGTVFAQWQRQGRLNLPAEEVCDAMYDMLCDRLAEHGFYQYEISNFAKKGRESKHNTKYWFRTWGSVRELILFPAKSGGKM